MPKLLIVFDANDPDARLAADIYHYAHGPAVEHPVGQPLPDLEWHSVLFIGAPPASVLAFALAEACAVAALATYEPTVLPRGRREILWASGPTLEEAALRSTSERAPVPPTGS